MSGEKNRQLCRTPESVAQQIQDFPGNIHTALTWLLPESDDGPDAGSAALSQSYYRILGFIDSLPDVPVLSEEGSPRGRCGTKRHALLPRFPPQKSGRLTISPGSDPAGVSFPA